MKIFNNTTQKLDYCISRLGKIKFKYAVKDFIDSIIIYALMCIIFGLLIYSFHITTVIHGTYVTTEQLCFMMFFVIAMGTLSMYPEIFISTVLTSRKLNKKINMISQSENMKSVWVREFLSSKYPSLIDLIVAKRDNLVCSTDYIAIKKLFISKYSNCIVRKKFMKEFDVITKRKYFIDIDQQDIDDESIFVLYDIAEELEINTDELFIIRNNFIKNSVLVDKNILLKMKSLNILTDDEYNLKLQQVNKLFRQKIMHLIKSLALFNLLLCGGLGVSFFKS